MEIRPPKPPDKKGRVEKKKAADIQPHQDDIFTRMITSGIEQSAGVEPKLHAEIEDLTGLHQQFIASVNHEINNPLFVVKGIAELMDESEKVGIKKRIIEISSNITAQIESFNQRDIKALSEECWNAPLSEITFREDLVACYLAKVIAPLTINIGQCLDDMEKVLEIEKQFSGEGHPEYDKIKMALGIIRRHADRIRQIIIRLGGLLPDNIETTRYVEELKMVNLKTDE